MLLESVVVALGRVGGGCCESPAHIPLARFIVLACVFVQVVWGDLVELLPDVIGDVFDDVGVGLGGGEMIAEELLVEGEDALNFDAEGDLEGGVEHGDGVLWIREHGVEVRVHTEGLKDESVRLMCRDLGELSASLKHECNLRREGT